MATRATYLVRVRKDNECFTQFFYCHWDGYPAGAASYFRKALDLEFKQAHGVNMIKRLCALDGFELTHCHEEHGDTEYKYEIFEADYDDIHIDAHEVSIEGNSTLVFSGVLGFFLESYKEEK